MIEICPKCGNYEWDKVVDENDRSKIKCPKCSHEWNFKGLPLFILTGCSGVGKTTTAIELQQRNTDFIVLDADFFTIMPSETNEDWEAHIEHMQRISVDIMQAGLPVMWTMAGCVDKLYNTYNSRFFSGIYCLALVCQEEDLRYRMTEGRKITDENWIKGSVDYNKYFLEHDKIGDVVFDKCDITGMSVSEVADYVIEWVKEKI